MSDEKTHCPSSRPALGLAMVGSNLTAIGAELIGAHAGYETFLAVRRRNTHTSLPVVMDSDDWPQKLRRIGYFGARRRIRDFEAYISDLVGGRPYDCFIHHSKDPFSQLLSSHPLCRRFFYIEEGFTSHLGDKFGTPKKRRLQRFIWKFRSAIFYGNRINIYRPHFDLKARNFGGVYAMSRKAFPGFANRIQLPFRDLPTTEPVPAGVVIFLDSQYILGRCTEDEYAAAMVACLSSLLEIPTHAAIKFHPSEIDEARKQRLIDRVKNVAAITEVAELPQAFVAERMAFDPALKVVIGTTALGVYIGERGFATYSFAHRIRKFDELMKIAPAAFRDVCINA